MLVGSALIARKTVGDNSCQLDQRFAGFPLQPVQVDLGALFEVWVERHQTHCAATPREIASRARFLAELCSHVEGQGAARSWPVFLAGISQGARYAEHVARNGLLPVTGLFLVAGTALQFSRRQMPVPQLRASMVLVMGTGDPTTPYRGGRLTRTGLIGFIQRRRARRHGELAGEDVVAGAEEVVLFTDLDNPTSNKIYREVGYRRFADWEDHRFVAPR